MIAYMLTWTTYGTWLQGDERGYCKDTKVLSENPALNNSNYNRLKQKAVYLSDHQRNLVKTAIYEEAKRIGQRIYALTVQENHVHLVLKKTKEKIESAVHRYKRAATFVLRKEGVKGIIWTKGYDKRYCFNVDDLKSRIDYVLRHDVERNQTPATGCGG